MSGLKRNTIDKFYTNNITVELCSKIMKTHLDVDFDNDFIIEPSAGNGSFKEIILSLCNYWILIDIEPEDEDIDRGDYLEYEPEDVYRKIHVIGNPPFGRQSSTAIKFIKHSAKFCDTISFILPKSFKKDSMKYKFPLNFHLVKQVDLSKNCFLLNGEKHDVPCVFQIWEKREELRPRRVILRPSGYNFVKKTDEHDISFRRVGGTAGTISRDTESKSIQSHYFIKFDRVEDIDNVKDIIFECNNTVGPKSISKQELIEKYNEKLRR
jgi:hypothetical protein